MADNNRLTRRQFVQTAAAGAGFLTMGMLLAGCDKSSGGGGGDQPAEAEDKPLDCTDVSGLDEAGKKTREAFNYVEETTVPGKLCANCQLYQPPPSGDGCGGCTIVKGPINPNGYCTSWVQRTG